MSSIASVICKYYCGSCMQTNWWSGEIRYRIGASELQAIDCHDVSYDPIVMGSYRLGERSHAFQRFCVPDIGDSFDCAGRALYIVIGTDTHWFMEWWHSFAIIGLFPELLVSLNGSPSDAAKLGFNTWFNLSYDSSIFMTQSLSMIIRICYGN
jgi:hypothetical protein